MQRAILVILTFLSVSASAQAACPNPLPDKPSGTEVIECLKEINGLRAQLNTVRERPFAVFAECHGDCEKGLAARCPAGTRMTSGARFYNAPDQAPHGILPSWLMCYNQSAKCPNSGSENECSLMRPNPARDDPSGDKGCTRPYFPEEVGIIMASCTPG
jgi:hypothetical protein